MGRTTCLKCGSAPGPALRNPIKGLGEQSSSNCSSWLYPCGKLSLLPARKMSFNGQVCNYGSYSANDVNCPAPYANAWSSEPCVTSCGDSRAVVYPPPVTIVFPGPILSSCPQESIVSSSSPLEIGSSFGYGSSQNMQSSFGSGMSLGGRNSYPCYSRRYTTYRSGGCRPC
ncbi:scale keratin-like [Melopsittacus undulatus]|uniref:scale keratin-like n=1 Tax=Melopsittacus undulatus TaxID=13146 RepID=UPI00146F87E0|nr:scale keratin-like [Melopsittacus undulatus]